jgi:hypothetical protein
MTVSSEIYRIEYTGDGSSTLFPVPFYFLSVLDLQVVLTVGGVSTQAILNTQYSVTGAGNPNGGAVTMVTAPASGTKVTIARDLSITQTTDWNENDRFPAEVVETAFDKITMIAQQLQEQLDRTIRVPIGSPPGLTDLPPPEAGHLIGWNEDATGLKNYDPKTFATVAANNRFVQSFTGDGTTTIFTLASDPGVLSNCEVFVDGLRLSPLVDYTLNSGDVVFVSAPVTGLEIVVSYGAASIINGGNVFSGTRFTSSPTPPSNATEGDRWFETDGGVLYTFVDSQWVEL